MIAQLCDLDLHIMIDLLWGLPLFFKANFLVLLDSFETREFILSQIACIFKCSNYNTSKQPLVSLTFIHVPVILLYTVKILKIGTPKIITIIVLQMGQLDFTVLYCVQKMQTE